MAADLALVESAARLALFADLGREELGGPAAADARGVLRRGRVGRPPGPWSTSACTSSSTARPASCSNDEELAVLPKGSFFGEISALLGERPSRTWSRERRSAASTSRRRRWPIPARAPEGDAPHAGDGGAPAPHHRRAADLTTSELQTIGWRTTAPSMDYLPIPSTGSSATSIRSPSSARTGGSTGTAARASTRRASSARSSTRTSGGFYRIAPVARRLGAEAAVPARTRTSSSRAS